MDVMPFPTSAGTNFITALPSDKATLVNKLIKAGAIILGKSRTHEFGFDTTGNNYKQGTSLNPCNINHYTGGSSSGSAAAAAFGICSIAIGADGGGSIRIPSAYCGLFGLKPTAWRSISLTKGIYSWRVSEHGSYYWCHGPDGQQPA
jgi:Asp-tRNA(Asn)/Glu-tRNA(Gln) amidotransferase A subunit family amidase